jgi:hypothetical protein
VRSPYACAKIVRVDTQVAAVRVKGVPGKVKTLKEIYRLSAGFGAKYEPLVGKVESAISERSPGTGVHVARVRVDPRDCPRHPAALPDRARRRESAGDGKFDGLCDSQGEPGAGA